MTNDGNGMVPNGQAISGMEPLDEQPGFGRLVNPDWLADQDADDPAGVIRELARS